MVSVCMEHDLLTINYNYNDRCDGLQDLNGQEPHAHLAKAACCVLAAHLQVC